MSVHDEALLEGKKAGLRGEGYDKNPHSDWFMRTYWFNGWEQGNRQYKEKQNGPE
ncbi:hypothetical protein [Ralstonia phage RSP15]|uniref:hypothetical protein n=1 Tax=Ralstonia phage RSP15 TaxID=1785960 RepID=UPI00074D48E8|nr:hypothetical protein BH754_gp117 [Ralstonia phage RSP15]BAU40189.1 hypothetical protein [Ralstonia phage RSP15]